MGLLTRKFRQTSTELSARDTPIFLFPDNNMSGDLTNLVHVLILRSPWFGIANGQILSVFDSYLPAAPLWWGIIVKHYAYNSEKPEALLFYPYR